MVHYFGIKMHSSLPLADRKASQIRDAWTEEEEQHGNEDTVIDPPTSSLSVDTTDLK